jgi:hypothetical protein
VPDLTPAAQRWLADHHGVITSACLRACGVRRSTIERLGAAGALRSIRRGVFVIASTPVTIEQRCAVLCATHPSGFVTGPTAGLLAGLRRMPRTASLHFAVRHGQHHHHLAAGVHFRQTTALISSHRVLRQDGIAVASPARLAFDLAADLSALDHLSVLQQLLHERKVTVDDLIAVERRLGHPARPGSGLFRRNLDRLYGSAPNESHHELLLAEALRTRGIPVENQSRVVRLSSGRTARVDLAVPAVRWGIELDIHPEHRTFEGQANDARRVRDLHLLEWQVEPVTEDDMANVPALADQLVELYRARCRTQPSAL